LAIIYPLFPFICTRKETIKQASNEINCPYLYLPAKGVGRVTEAKFESLLLKFEAMMIRENEEIPSYIWTVNYVEL
jgi:hypothetical protein